MASFLFSIGFLGACLAVGIFRCDPVERLTPSTLPDRSLGHGQPAAPAASLPGLCPFIALHAAPSFPAVRASSRDSSWRPCEVLPRVHRRPRKAMPADPIQAMEFAQSKGQARREGKTGTGFKDVAGIEYIQTELQDIVSVSLFC